MKPTLAKVLEFPLREFTPIKNPERFIYVEISGDLLEDLGINSGDEITIDTFETVRNGSLIFIRQNDKYYGGIAKFIGNGKIQLDYIAYSQTFVLSEIDIIGRVIKSQKDWRYGLRWDTELNLKSLLKK